MRVSAPGDKVGPMTSTAPQQYRWTRDGFLRAYEAGAFEGRVELVDGEVWPVVIGRWHGTTVMRVARALPEPAIAEIDSATLPAASSLPDPDCWVRRRGAVPKGAVSDRVPVWASDDVLLVIEVADESLMADLTIKAKLYGSSGYPVYWVISPDVIYEHSGPTADGYRVRTEYRRGDRIPVPYADAELLVDDLLLPSDG